MATSPPLQHRLFIGAIVVIAFLSLGQDRSLTLKPETLELAPLKLDEPSKPAKDEAPLYLETFIPDAGENKSHAASITELYNGRIMAAWFAGSREGAKDVAIYTATYSPSRMKWSKPVKAIDRLGSMGDLNRYIKKLGNPVIMHKTSSEVWMFYVSASLGGWATSHINLAKSFDNGKTWQAPKRLVTSPFWNMSTLVKGQPVKYKDGRIGLPVYHEIANKLGEYLILDQHGELLTKQRMTYGEQALQPVVLNTISEDKKAQPKLIALMRNANKDRPRHVLMNTSDDNGLTWTPVTKLDVFNPNSALTGLAVGGSSGNNLVMVGNDSIDHRQRLSLYTASNAQDWKLKQRFEDLETPYSHTPEKKPSLEEYNAKLSKQLIDANFSNKQIESILERVNKSLCSKPTESEPQFCKGQFDYPYMIQSRSGDIHLVYSWNGVLMKHIRFNESWLVQNL